MKSFTVKNRTACGVLRNPANSPGANLGELQLRSARVNGRSGRKVGAGWAPGRVTLPGTPSPTPPAGLARKSLRCNGLGGFWRPKCGVLKDLSPKDIQTKDLESSMSGKSCKKNKKPRGFVRGLCVSIFSVARSAGQIGRFFDKCAYRSSKLRRCSLMACLAAGFELYSGVPRHS